MLFRSFAGTKPVALSSVRPSCSIAMFNRTSSSRMARWCTLPWLARRATASNDGDSASATIGSDRCAGSSVIICSHKVRVLAAADISVCGSGSAGSRTLAVTALRFKPVVTDSWLMLGSVPFASQARRASSIRRSRSRFFQVSMLDAEGQREPDQRAHDARASAEHPGELAFRHLRHLLPGQGTAGATTLGVLRSSAFRGHRVSFPSLLCEQHAPCSMRQRYAWLPAGQRYGAPSYKQAVVTIGQAPS